MSLSHRPPYQRVIDPLRLVRWGDRPLVAYTIGSRSNRVASVLCLDAHTLKRRVVRMAAMVACRLGIDAAMARGEVLQSRDVKEVFAGLEQCAKTLGNVASISLIWPADPCRKRLYAHFLDGQGKPIAFGKISLNLAEDRLLMSEAATINEVAAAAQLPVYVPRIWHVIAHEEGHIVLMESLSRSAHTRIPSDTELLAMRDKFAGVPVRLSKSELEALPWVVKLKRDDEVLGKLFPEIETALAHGAVCCVVHGDYGCNNARWFDDQMWVYDWERSSPCGPLLTDEVNVFLGKHVRSIFGRSSSVVRRFEREYLHSARFAREQVLFALAYLHTVGSTLATNMLLLLRRSEYTCHMGRRIAKG